MKAFTSHLQSSLCPGLPKKLLLGLYVVAVRNHVTMQATPMTVAADIFVAQGQYVQASLYLGDDVGIVKNSLKLATTCLTRAWGPCSSSLHPSSLLPTPALATLVDCRLASCWKRAFTDCAPNHSLDP